MQPRFVAMGATKVHIGTVIGRPNLCTAYGGKATCKGATSAISLQSRNYHFAVQAQMDWDIAQKGIGATPALRLPLGTERGTSAGSAWNFLR
jgi:hypothetical protein